MTYNVFGGTLNLTQLEISLYHVVQNTFQYLEPFRRGSQVWRTDRRTDGQNHC